LWPSIASFRRLVGHKQYRKFDGSNSLPCVQFGGSGVSILLAADLRCNRKLEAYATTSATLPLLQVAGGLSILTARSSFMRMLKTRQLSHDALAIPRWQ
jgi:hypothetical protein